MSGNEVRLTNGQRWTARQFLDHYFQPSGSGSPVPVAGPPSPVSIDMSWYMSEGPGRFYHPGLFPVIDKILENRTLAPGTYNLLDFVPNRDPKDTSLSAKISNYSTNPLSTDYKTRALVFGDESATISGQVVVKRDGSKTFEKIEIRPWDTNFDFRNNNAGLHIELPRRMARALYDPESHGTTYDIEYRGQGRLGESNSNRGIGRVYHPFTASQLSGALRKESVYPGSAPPGLLPSFTAAPPPAIDEHLRYLDQMNANRLTSGVSAPSPFGHSSSPASPPNDVAGWIASMAGVDPANPTHSQQSKFGAPAGSPAQKLLPPWVFLGPQ